MYSASFKPLWVLKFIEVYQGQSRHKDFTVSILVAHRLKANFACLLTVHQKKAKMHLLNVLELKLFSSNIPKHQRGRKSYSHKRGVLQNLIWNIFVLQQYLLSCQSHSTEKSLYNSDFYIVHMIYGFPDAYFLLQ